MKYYYNHSEKVERMRECARKLLDDLLPSSENEDSMDRAAQRRWWCEDFALIFTELAESQRTLLSEMEDFSDKREEYRWTLRNRKRN